MTNEIQFFASFLTALFAALFATPKLAHIASRIGLVDHPGIRKMHNTPRPLVGGLGIIISATFSSMLWVPLGGLRGFFAGLSVLLLIGVFDDFLNVGHRKKFIAQTFATSLLIYFSDAHLYNFGNLLGFGDLSLAGLGWLAWPVTIFCVVGVTNAVNMIDGLDGLAGGIAFISLFTFAALASLGDMPHLMLLSLSFAGAVLGFLRYNWSPASLFMGDAGSLCLGFILSFLAIALTQQPDSPIRPVTVLLVLAVPISDTITVMVQRIRNGRSPFSPDKTHLHHRLVEMGMRREGAVLTLLTLSGGFSVLAIAGVIYQLPEPLLFGVFLTYFICNYFSESIGQKSVNLISPFLQKEKPHYCPRLIHSCLRTLAVKRFFRGAERFQAQFTMRCAPSSPEITALSGEILNISRNGFMARLAGTGFSCRQCQVEIHIKNPNGTEIAEFNAEHLWSTVIDAEELHGFRFVTLSEQQLSLLKETLRKLSAGKRLSHI